MGRWLDQNGWTPDRIIASPARRAVETADAVASQLQPPPQVATARPLYEGGSAVYRAELFGSTHTVLVVGHNPAIEDLARSLGADVTGGLPPASVVCIEDGHAMATWSPGRLG